jgi:hypothetical protein
MTVNIISELLLLLFCCSQLVAGNYSYKADIGLTGTVDIFELDNLLILITSTTIIGLQLWCQ